MIEHRASIVRRGQIQNPHAAGSRIDFHLSHLCCEPRDFRHVLRDKIGQVKDGATVFFDSQLDHLLRRRRLFVGCRELAVLLPNLVRLTAQLPRRQIDQLLAHLIGRFFDRVTGSIRLFAAARAGIERQAIGVFENHADFLRRQPERLTHHLLADGIVSGTDIGHAGEDVDLAIGLQG